MQGSYKTSSNTMKGLNYITSKQRIWATRKGLNSTGSKGERGEKNYLNPLENNLWGGKGTLTAIGAEFNAADGQELKGNDDDLPKMSALHSSSALAVNVFQYWREKSRDITPLAAACGLCRGDNQYKKTIKFEEKFSIFDEAECSKNTRHPNIDVVIHVEQNGERVFAIESKFTKRQLNGVIVTSSEPRRF
ncbi:hypothetical protein FACS189443_1860 [Planctomycetales bacterium]|nr:hypothetical protein FACS189443_1860 [Planctomycetales bacterium]